MDAYRLRNGAFETARTTDSSASPAVAVENILDGRDDLVLSPPILRDVLSVLGRKFSRDREEPSPLTVFRDAPDNRILECAVEGKADVIVTGDKAMLVLRIYQEIRLVSLAVYLGRRGRKPK